MTEQESKMAVENDLDWEGKCFSVSAEYSRLHEWMERREFYIFVCIYMVQIVPQNTQNYTKKL